MNNVESLKLNGRCNCGGRLIDTPTGWKPRPDWRHNQHGRYDEAGKCLLICEFSPTDNEQGEDAHPHT